ncbi:hypothetical protein [Streptomyces sp. AB3(2024)]|uniref:hypothetical protein n=1 Tax=Streptomyces sp. AB3(2024) TaxID=3317321 RepID=UPI0035A2F2F0
MNRPRLLATAGIASPPFKALTVGAHTSTVFVTLRAEHCDGLGTVREDNCLPAGTTPYTWDTPFEVQPRPRDLQAREGLSG